MRGAIINIPSTKIKIFGAVFGVFFFATFSMSEKALAFSGGTGTSLDPYQITTAAELQSMNSYLGSGNSNKYFKLMNNIDLNVSPYNTGAGWTPIGNSSNRFYGKFDGNYKTVSNLYINSTSSLGLFGEIASGGTVSNIQLSSVNVAGSSSSIGSLAGSNYGTIQRAGATSGTVAGFQRVGGLVGSNQGGLSYAFSRVAVTFNPLPSTATCCAGGLAGEVAFGGASATLSNSYSTGSLYISLSTAYNQGSMGGILGNDYSSGTKSNLYSTGAITIVSGGLPAGTGGLSGGQYTSITSSYWDTESSGLATSYGGAGVIGRTTSQMKDQSTYSGWDFTNTWAIDGTNTINNGYPYLQWETLVDNNSNPNTPSSLGGSTYINGSWNTDDTPTFSFTLSDTNSSDTLRYQIQIDDSSDFSSPVVDYTSALATQGASSFTVGQTAGSGSYTTGSSGQTLSNGSYYWRVRATDNNSAQSSYATANSGAVAFKIDDLAPSATGTPSSTTPTSDSTPLWIWTGSIDADSGLEVYMLRWSQDSLFGSYSYTTTGNSTYEIPISLSDGLWYFIVAARDVAQNISSFSSNGSVLIDTTAPSAPGTPNITTGTNDNTPTLVWTSSTDSGSGLNATPYTVEWSKDNGFGFGVLTSTSNTNSHTIASALSDGTWYFRVKAQDALNNNSAYSANGSATIDTTVPISTGNSTSITIPKISTKPSSTAVANVETEAQTQKNTVLLNDYVDYTEGEGKQLTTSTGEVVHFTHNKELHSVTVNQLGDEFAYITIASVPKTFKLYVGQTITHDVDGNGVDDIQVTLASINSGVADFTFKQLVPASSTKTASVNTPTVAEKSRNQPRYVVILTIASLLLFLLTTRYRRRKNNR